MLIDIMRGIVMLAIIVLLYVIVGYDAQAMEQTTVDQYAGYAERYGWPLIAIIGSPVLSWRITQWYKLTAKRHRGRKPSVLCLDLVSFALVYGMCYLAWSKYADNGIIVAGIVAILHTSIVKAVFAYAPKPVAEALAYGISDNTILTVFVGKDARTQRREQLEAEENTRVLTPDERAEITGGNKS